MMPRPQFRLKSLFALTAIVAVGCLVGPPIVRGVRARFWPPEMTTLPAEFWPTDDVMYFDPAKPVAPNAGTPAQELGTD
jgi:hypothetical protein